MCKKFMEQIKKSLIRIISLSVFITFLFSNLSYALRLPMINSISIEQGVETEETENKAIALDKHEIDMILHEVKGLISWLSGLTYFFIKAGIPEDTFSELKNARKKISTDDAKSKIGDILEDLYQVFSEQQIEEWKTVIQLKIGNIFTVYETEFNREKILIELSTIARVIRLYSGYYIGREAIKKKHVRLNDILSSCPFVKQRLRETITKDFRAGDIEIYTDEVALFQIMRNLLRNALESTADDRENRITIRTILDETAEFVLIQIKDTGTGMSEETLSKILFSRFTTKEYGKGLGLTIVKRLVETRCGGTIELESELGKGTTFTITLPVFNKEVFEGITIFQQRDIQARI